MRFWYAYKPCPINATYNLSYLYHTLKYGFQVLDYLVV